MIELPDGKELLVPFCNELIEKCRISVGMRANLYRVLSRIYETGRYDGPKSLINTLPSNIARLAAHLYSPVQLKFSMSYTNPYPQLQLDRAKQAAKVLSAEWGRDEVSADVLWGRGVVDSLKYGAAFIKQWAEEEWGQPVFQRKLVMPWQMGVYREDENDLNKQEAIVETSALTMPEVWRRIHYLPNAKDLFNRIKSHANTGMAGSPDSFFHQVLSTTQLNTSGIAGGTQAGGVVNIHADPNYAVMGPQIGVETVEFHELWVKGADDYVTIQIVEPDVLIAPLFKKSNLLGVKRQQPYDLIQPNSVSNWIWGRSEMMDLVEPQGLLATWCDDLKRLYGLQVDKLIGFSGDGTNLDERYDAMREGGYLAMPPGTTITDLTPKIPPEALPLLRFCLEIINTIGGFPPVMQGQGDQGIRASSQLDTMIKTASPTQRDRSLLIERQLATAAGKSFRLMQAKDPKFYWTDGSTPDAAESTKFLLGQLPEDAKVVVDAHSGSPIFSDDATQLIFQARKNGDVDSEYMLSNLPFPNSEVAIAAARKRAADAAAQQQQMVETAKQMPSEVQGKILENQFKRK